jgi:hypothetical protein
LRELTIPAGVTVVENGAFYGLTDFEITWVYNPLLSSVNFRDYLTTVIIPDTVTELGAFAFQNCAKLQSIELHGGIGGIGAWAFAGCVSLENLRLPQSVYAIGAWTFDGCVRLTIDAEAGFKPSGWDNMWNPAGRPVTWGAV